LIAATVFMVVATAVTARSFTDASTLARVLEGGHWPWITAAVVSHAVYFVGYALLYQLAFAVVGVTSRTWPLVPVYFAGLFVNLIVPAGAGSVAFFVDDSVRRGQDGARTSIGIVLVLLLDLITLIPFVLWGVIFMMRERLFASWQVLAAACFLLYVVLLVVLLALSRRKQAWVCRVLAFCHGLLVRVLRRLRVRVPADDWPTRTAAGFCDAAGAIVARPGRLAVAALCATVLHVVEIAGLWLFVRGFGADVSVGGLVAVFALSTVLVVIVAIPQLAPVSQAFMTATFISVGIAAGPAVATTLAFRGRMLVLPLLIGLPCAWRLGRFGTRSSSSFTERGCPA
jgi:uncharacterized membrane protein YbhN (UPF0104 family)